MSHLRTKLLAAMLAIVVITVTLSALFTRRVTHEEMRRVLVAHKGPTNIAALDEQYRRTGSWKGVEPLLDAIEGRVILATRDRQVIAASKNLRDAAITVDATDRITIRDRGAMMMVRLPPTVVHDAYLYVLPLEEPGGGGEIAALDRRLVITFAGATVLAILLALYMSRRITQPVERLTKAVDEMARGATPAHVDVPGRDELARLATSFNAMSDAIAEQQALRRRMVSDVAHELRTPLTNLRCELEAVQDGLAAADPARISSLHEEVAHLGRLVDDLQDLAVADAGGLRLRREPIDLAATVARAAEPFRTQRSIEISLPPEPLIVNADATRIGQVVRNLLTNAVQHTADAGHIQVDVHRNGSGAVVQVADDGHGIPAADLEKIFERFYRVDESRGRERGGAGLGLAIARQLVELHGGTIRAENRSEGGARFSVFIPS
jgi:two-component system sensor histidine kinase BaeS